jgi:hypothetical protein
MQKFELHFSIKETKKDISVSITDFKNETKNFISKTMHDVTNSIVNTAIKEKLIYGTMWKQYSNKIVFTLEMRQGV